MEALNHAFDLGNQVAGTLFLGSQRGEPLVGCDKDIFVGAGGV
jgi:hypothetical protein